MPCKLWRSTGTWECPGGFSSARRLSNSGGKACHTIWAEGHPLQGLTQSFCQMPSEAQQWNDSKSHGPSGCHEPAHLDRHEHTWLSGTPRTASKQGVCEGHEVCRAWQQHPDWTFCPWLLVRGWSWSATRSRELKVINAAQQISKKLCKILHIWEDTRCKTLTSETKSRHAWAFFFS